MERNELAQIQKRLLDMEKDWDKHFYDVPMGNRNPDSPQVNALRAEMDALVDLAKKISENPVPLPKEFEYGHPGYKTVAYGMRVLPSPWVPVSSWGVIVPFGKGFDQKLDKLGFEPWNGSFLMPKGVPDPNLVRYAAPRDFVVAPKRKTSVFKSWVESSLSESKRSESESKSDKSKRIWEMTKDELMYLPLFAHKYGKKYSDYESDYDAIGWKEGWHYNKKPGYVDKTGYAGVLKSAAERGLIAPQSKSEKKEPWEMTRGEWMMQEAKRYNSNISPTKTGKRLSRITKFERNPDIRLISENKQRDSIKQALSEGKPVPPEVLKDYPGLITSKTPGYTSAILTQEDIKKINRRMKKEGTLELSKSKAHPAVPADDELKKLFGKNLDKGEIIDEIMKFVPKDSELYDSTLRSLGALHRYELRDSLVELRKNKSDKPSLSELQAIESSRSSASQASDEARSNADTIPADSPRVARWLKDQGSSDIEDVDTPMKHNKAKRKVKSPAKPRPTSLGRMR